MIKLAITNEIIKFHQNPLFLIAHKIIDKYPATASFFTIITSRNTRSM